jgi:hypothetical protein
MLIMMISGDVMLSCEKPPAAAVPSSFVCLFV